MHSNNAQQALTNILANTPQMQPIMQMLKNGGNAKAIYENLARQMNVDPNWLINKLTN